MRMNENWTVACTNLMALYPLVLMYRSADWISFFCLLNVSIASFVSHLFECHKHGMPGNGASERTSYLLNRWDVAGCVVFAARFAAIFIVRYGPTPWPLVLNGLWPVFILFLVANVFLRISEYDKYNARLKDRYIITHCAWHFMIFQVIGLYYLMLLG